MIRLLKCRASLFPPEHGKESNQNCLRRLRKSTGQLYRSSVGTCEKGFEQTAASPQKASSESVISLSSKSVIRLLYPVTTL